MKLQKLFFLVSCVFGTINVQAVKPDVNVKIDMTGGGYLTKEACEKNCGKNSCKIMEGIPAYGWVCFNFTN